jgi:hypothetical protein
MTDETANGSTLETVPHTYQIGPAEQATTAVITAVAAVTDMQPTELGPLFDSIDPDALDNWWLIELLYRSAFS